MRRAPALDPTCAMCSPLPAPTPLFADDLWQVRHIEPPWGVAGWLVLASRRHATSLAELDDAEAAALGPALRRCQRALSRATAAERIYLASLNEKVPHFHVHLVPRTAAVPAGSRGFALFDLQRAAAAGAIAVDAAEVARIGERFVAALAEDVA